ncbi:hypothetical protein ES703_71251 [subsurface metagenome]
MDGFAQSIAIAISIATITLMVVVIIYWMIKRRRELNNYYDIENKMADMDEMRHRLEREIYVLQNRIVSTDQRWRDVQHLLLSSQERQPDSFQDISSPYLSQFLRGLGLTNNDLAIENDLVFLLTPFNKQSRESFDITVDVCRSIGMRCLRGDEQYVSGELLPHIIRLVAKSRLIIANIQGRNPNVLYELGIAHAMDKPTILLTKSPVKAPIDIRAKHLVIYTDEKSLREELQMALSKALVKI